MDLAREHGVKSIAFPAISTGVYRFPEDCAAEIAVRACAQRAGACGVERIEFCCFDEATAAIYEQLLNERLLHQS